MNKTIIMKFGGASLASPEQFSQIAEIIISRLKEYPRIVIVVSAMANTTDQLIALAKQVNPNPPQREYDMLITAGERISVALLAMALAAKNQQAMSFTGSQSGIITSEQHAEARIVDVRPIRLISSLDQGKIVIVAGFQGVSQKEREITTLGRGGSDTTAVALGVALGAAKVEFFKDVPGVFNDDPKKNPQATSHLHLTYNEALKIMHSGAKVLHSRCIELASKNHLPLHVLSFQDYNQRESKGTMIFDSAETSQAGKVPIYETT